jgi:homoserine kinase
MPYPHFDEFEIRVPASIANLGPGFDTLALAVQLYLHVRAQRIAGTNELRFEFLNQRLEGENCIERAFRWLARQHAGSFPSLHLEVTSDIPMKAGLGSSAAATVTGLRLYEALMGTLPIQALLNAAAALEGHPDNAAAALFGGLTACCQLPDGSVFAAPLKWPKSLVCVVLTPDCPVATSEARRVLPRTISREDAIFNLQRIVLLVHALQTGNFSLLSEALRDRLHQQYRMCLMPHLEYALSLQHPDLLGVCLSGAGPSIVALAQNNVGAVEELLSNAYSRLGLAFTIRRLRVHDQGDAIHGVGREATACEAINMAYKPPVIH